MNFLIGTVPQWLLMDEHPLSVFSVAGNNGSGKSAILTAITMALGGAVKASVGSLHSKAGYGRLLMLALPESGQEGLRPRPRPGAVCTPSHLEVDLLTPCA